MYREDRVLFAGIANTVACELRLLGYTVQVKRDRPEPEFNWRFTGTYRPFQEESIIMAHKAMQGIVKAAPGCGKTAMAAGLICKAGVPSIILVQNERPFKQAIEALEKFTDIADIGIIGDSLYSVANVNVVMVQTAARLISSGDEYFKLLLNSTKLVITDECHHCPSDSYLKVFANLPNLHYNVGYSATPHRDDHKHMLIQALLGDIEYEVTYGAAIDHGILCPVTIFFKDMERRSYKKVDESKYVKETSEGIFVNDYMIRRSKLDRYQSIYKDYIIENTDRNMSGINFAKQANSKGLSCAIIVSRIDHANKLKKLMPDAMVITSKTKNTGEAFARLQNHEVMTVITTLMDEAVDVPSLGCVALMAGGKSSVKLIQRLRSLRSFSGEVSTGYYKKDRGYVFYPLDNADHLSYHSKICSDLLKQLVLESDKNVIKKI